MHDSVVAAHGMAECTAVADVAFDESERGICNERQERIPAVHERIEDRDIMP